MTLRILALLLLAAPAFAGHHVAVSTDNGNAGSAAVFYKHSDKNLYVAITARHVIEGARTVRVSVQDWQTASKFYWLESVDAAFIEFTTDVPLNPHEVGDVDAQPGDEVDFLGFAYGNDWVEGRQSGVVAEVGTAKDAKYPPYKGQSGGAVINADKKLVGVVTATSPNTLIYAPISEIKAGCERQWGYWWGVGACPPGGCPIPAPRPPSRFSPPPRSISPQPILPQPQPDAPIPQAGRDGKDGVPGPPGKDGRDGKDADAVVINALKVELAELKAQLAAMKEQKIPVQLLLPDGTVYDQATYTLGKPLKFKFFEADEK